jgi:hypothetical protein
MITCVDLRCGKTADSGGHKFRCRCGQSGQLRRNRDLFWCDLYYLDWISNVHETLLSVARLFHEPLATAFQEDKEHLCLAMRNVKIMAAHTLNTTQDRGQRELFRFAVRTVQTIIPEIARALVRDSRAAGRTVRLSLAFSAALLIECGDRH